MHDFQKIVTKVIVPLCVMKLCFWFLILRGTNEY